MDRRLTCVVNFVVELRAKGEKKEGTKKKGEVRNLGEEKRKN